MPEKEIGLQWEVGLQNPGAVAILARHHWVEFKSPETSREVTLSPHQYDVSTEFPLAITSDKAEVLLDILVHDPTAEEWLNVIVGEHRTLQMTIRIGYQITGRKQHNLQAAEVSEVFTFPEKAGFTGRQVAFPTLR